MVAVGLRASLLASSGLRMRNWDGEGGEFGGFGILVLGLGLRWVDGSGIWVGRGGIGGV